MTSKEQRRQNKKKRRERAVSDKLLARRLTRQAEQKAERKEQLMEHRIKKIVNKMGRYGQHIDPESLKDMPEEVSEQLERNVKILEALEKEHQQEIERRDEINEALEEEGSFTLEDKLKAARRKMFEQDVETSLGRKENFLDIMVASDRPREVADVSVVKATPAKDQ